MFRLTLVSLIFLTACSAPTEYVAVKPDIPNATLTPCRISDRKAKTVNQLVVLAIEHRRAAECANGKIETIAQIINKPN